MATLLQSMLSSPSSFANAASDLLKRNDGLSGGYSGDSFALRVCIITIITISWYNSVELNVLVFVTFRKYGGLYFWSLLISSWGIIVYGMGFLFKFMQIVANDYVNVALITIGWWAMVTGQAFVLYSRLHLVLSNRKRLHQLFYMIIINFFILHLPTTVLTFGSNVGNNVDQFVSGYTIMEKIQMTGFCIQEAILSGVYLYESTKFLKNDEIRKSRRVLHQLIAINIVIVLMDLALLCLEYAGLYILEIVIKGVVYSVKLKLELAILGQLINYVRRPPPVMLNVIHSGNKQGQINLTDEERMDSFSTDPSQVGKVDQAANKIRSKAQIHFARVVRTHTANSQHIEFRKSGSNTFGSVVRSGEP